MQQKEGILSGPNRPDLCEDLAGAITTAFVITAQWGTKSHTRDLCQQGVLLEHVLTDAVREGV